MRTPALACASLVLSTPAFAGDIHDQFAAGIGGIPWGVKLDDLIAMRPGGNQYFSTGPGGRSYELNDDAPLFGIERPGMRVQYHLGKSNEVRYVALGVPYAMREQLLGQLTAMFGRYWESSSDPLAISYYWPADDRVRISVRASRDPKNGILEFWVSVIPPEGARR
jgi:hypothetical protein